MRGALLLIVTVILTTVTLPTTVLFFIIAAPHRWHAGPGNCCRWNTRKKITPEDLHAFDYGIESNEGFRRRLIDVHGHGQRRAHVTGLVGAKASRSLIGSFVSEVDRSRTGIDARKSICPGEGHRDAGVVPVIPVGARARYRTGHRRCPVDVYRQRFRSFLVLGVIRGKVR